ncbi:hypothetical protein DL98DRAFT_632164 [Cadophora sp. DSE1049]|nr:hypothetical protein DL98DRAFT_632164 [Cadophora sp. DSE1049]
MYILAFFKRALRLRDETIVPAVCYATCNNAYLEAESVGLSPELCAVDSGFLQGYEYCQSCVSANSANGSESVQVYVDPKFAKFIDYCNAQEPIPVIFPANATSTVTTVNATAASLYTSQRSAFSYYASVYSAASLLGLLNATTIVLVTVTPSVSAFIGTITTQTSTPKETPTPESSSKAWIAGAVAGPVLLLLLSAGIWFFIRKKKLQSQQVTGLNTPEKAQLHSDSVVKPTYELEGEGEVQNISELPAREPVGNELDVRRGEGRDVG